MCADRDLLPRFRVAGEHRRWRCCLENVLVETAVKCGSTHDMMRWPKRLIFCLDVSDITRGVIQGRVDSLVFYH